MNGKPWPIVSGLLFVLLALLWVPALCFSQTNLQSGDGYIRREGTDWVIGTSFAEKRIRLAGGRFSSISVRNKKSGREYQPATAAPEIRFTADGQDVSAAAWLWQLSTEGATRGSQGELDLHISISSAGLQATQHYVIYPGTPVIREWMMIENRSGKAIHVGNLSFWHAATAGTQGFRFNYITGGGNYNGSQLLKSDPMGGAFQRSIDSNGGTQAGAYSGFLPLIFLSDQQGSEGIAVGWDYMGHWRFEIGNQSGNTRMQLALVGIEKDLAPGEMLETPKAFTAPFSGGVDELGNQLLDWQYGYMWEYTNPEYFAKTRWAVDWPDPWIGDGGTPSADNWGRRLALDLRYVDLLRETGTDILWDDAGWYDRWGSWNGPDWQITNDYVRKHDMRWVLWYPTFLATARSAVGQQHPEWLIPGQEAFEQSNAATADWQSKLLDKSIVAWGDYQWRYDIAPAASASDTGLLDADQNFRKLLQQFKTTHPESGIDACDGGGRWISYDLARLAESGEYTDGGVGPYSAYYTSLVVPPDKLHNVVDFDHTYYAAATDRTHLGMDPTWYRDPGDGPDVESIRKDWELYHYLVAQGVAGRWSHIFRPKVDHDDPVWYLQRMNRDSSKGVILTKHEKHGATYFVTSRLVKAAPNANDRYRGDAGAMNLVTTTSAATLVHGIYEDTVDSAARYYGVPGQEFGPLNVKYQSGTGNQSLVTKIEKLGADRAAADHFFGMALQLDQPMTITSLGQFDPGNNRGIYELSVVRAEDNLVLGTTTLDMSQASPDAMGFKYASLAQPIHLDASSKPLVIYPRGLVPTENYDVRALTSGLRLQETGSKLMAEGITLERISPGELIFLNLPRFPGSGTDHVAPGAPRDVAKKLVTNLGAQGVELSWSASHDDNWMSYYEVRKNGTMIGKSAIGTFFFDHSNSARNDIGEAYEIVAVDGDGNRSRPVAAQKGESELPRYEALGDFSATQSSNRWLYEQSVSDGVYRELTWDKGGYEGRWAGSGLGRIGRIWMQPSAQYDLSRTFVVPEVGVVSTWGEIRKDPSAENQAPCFVRILKNSEQVWPSTGWAEVQPQYSRPTTYRLTRLKVKTGDKLRFEVKHSGENRTDPILWNPKIVIDPATSP